MRTDLYIDPKVCVMANTLIERYESCFNVPRSVMRNVVIGALVSVWGMIRTQGYRQEDDLIVDGCPISVIDDLANIQGFSDAMMQVGWVKMTESGFALPRFFEHYVDPANDRAKSKAKQLCSKSNHPLLPGIGAEEGMGRAEPEAVLTYPCKGVGEQWRLTQEDLDKLNQTYGSTVNVLAECKKALAWIEASPTRRKTASGMMRFLIGWLNRTQERVDLASMPTKLTFEEKARIMLAEKGIE